MTVWTRRGFCLGAMAIGCIPLAPACARPPLPIPDGPLRLNRTITRGLGDGAQIVVNRQWHVIFARQGSGLSITGKQVTAQVSAPPSLAALAKIEEQRSTDAMFPILLNADGAVLSSGHYVLEAHIAMAVQEADALLGRQTIIDDRKLEHRRALAALQSSANTLLDQIPADLFFPEELSVHTVQPVSLENGLAGEFELEYKALCAPNSPWLGQATRRVITRIGDTERQASDAWSMAPV